MAVAYGSELANYVNEQKLPLLRKLVLAPRSTKYFNLFTGVHGDTNINLLDTAVTFGDGSACGWSDGNTATFSAKKLEARAFKVQQSICDKAMLNYWNGYAVKVAAGQKDGNLPFAEDFMASLGENMAKALEKEIWVGNSGSGDRIDGLKTQIASDGSVVVATGGTTALTKTQKVLAALPADTIEKAEIFMGIDYFAQLVDQLTANNMFHYAPVVDESMTITFPGRTTKVHGVAGLNGTDCVISLVPEHTIYGVSMEEDVDDYKLWYSLDNQEYRIEVDFIAGVTYAYPTEVVYHA